MFSLFIDYLTIQGKAKTTIKAYSYDIKILLNYIKKKPEKITEKDLFNFFSYLTKNNIKPITRARYCSSIKLFFDFLYEYNKIKRNPSTKIHKPKIDKVESIYLNLPETITLLSNTKKRSKRHSERNYAIIILFVTIGIRLDELIKIDLEDIDFIEHKILIHGKGGKERIIYINNNCINAIKEYTQRKTGALFLSERGNRISRREVQYIIKTEIQNAGLNSKYSAHKLRHTCATLMYQNGTDLRVLQKILGHKNIGTTEIYIHTKDEQIKNAVERIGNLYEKLR